MDIRMRARVYDEGNPRVLHFTVRVPEPVLLDGFMPDITPEELEEILNASLREDAQAAEVPAMSMAQLDTIAARKRYGKRLHDTYKDNRQCSICLDEFYARTRRYVRELPCGHLFCSKCITKWITVHSASCPTCRNRLG